MQKPNFILDYETFAQDQFSCVAINCAYFLFDWDRFLDDPYSPEELLEDIKVAKFEIKEQKVLGWEVDSKTVKWWMDQENEVKAQAIPSPSDITLQVFANDLKEYLDGTKVKNWWSRSEFDITVLRRILDHVGIRDDINKNHLPFWAWRDTRSFLDGNSLFSVRNDFIPIPNEDEWNKIFKKHISRHDIMADILRLQTVVRLRNGLDI